MDTVPYILGIAHPPGLPLYTLAGWLFSHALPFGSVAFRMSLFSALCMSLAAWCVYAIVHELSGDRVAAVLASWIFAVGGVTWTVATRADVHALAIALYASALWLLLQWHREARPSRLYAAAIAFGLAVAAHPIALFLLPAILALVIAKLHQVDGRALLAASLIAVASATIWFLYLPLRSAAVTAAHLDPVAQLGIVGNAFWDYDHPIAPSQFFDLVFAPDVDVAAGLHAYANDGDFDAAASFVALAARELTWIGLAAAATGVFFAARKRDVRVLVLCIAGAAPALFALGFRDESDVSRYFLPAFVALGSLAGYGLASLRVAVVRFPAHAAMLVATAALLVSQPTISGQAGDRRAADAANAVLDRTPDDAIIVASWTLAPALAYRAYVDRAAGRRTIVPAWIGDVEDHVDGWSARRAVFVVGTPEGSVRGFRLERLFAHPELYRVQRTTAQL